MPSLSHLSSGDDLEPEAMKPDEAANQNHKASRETGCTQAKGKRKAPSGPKVRQNFVRIDRKVRSVPIYQS